MVNSHKSGALISCIRWSDFLFLTSYASDIRTVNSKEYSKCLYFSNILKCFQISICLEEIPCFRYEMSMRCIFNDEFDRLLCLLQRLKHNVVTYIYSTCCSIHMMLAVGLVVTKLRSFVIVFYFMELMSPCNNMV